MSQRVALFISAAVTMLAVLTGLGVAVLSAQSQTQRQDSTQVAEADAPDASVADRDQQPDMGDMIAILQASNTALEASYGRIASLLSEIDELRAQNAILRERDAQFQQRLAEASRRLALQDAPAAQAGAATEKPRPVASVASAAAPSRPSVVRLLPVGTAPKPAEANERRGDHDRD